MTRSARYAYMLCQRKGCPDYGKSVRREKIEGEFDALLRELRPSANLFSLATALFRDFWKQREAASETQGKAILTELFRLDRSISQFLDRVVDTDSPTLIKTYEERIRSLEEQKAVMRERAANFERPPSEFDATFRTALEFLSNPWKLWNSDRLEDKRAVLKLAFAERISYSRNGGFRTAVTSSPFTLLSQLERGEYEMVPLTGP